MGPSASLFTPFIRWQEQQTVHYAGETAAPAPCWSAREEPGNYPGACRTGTCFKHLRDAVSLQSYTRVVRILALRCAQQDRLDDSNLHNVHCSSVWFCVHTNSRRARLACLTTMRTLDSSRTHRSTHSLSSMVCGQRRLAGICPEKSPLESKQDGARSCPCDRLSGRSCFSVYLMNNPISTQRARVSCTQFTWIVCHRCCTGGFQCRTASSIGHRTDLFIYVRARNLAAAGHYHDDGRSHRAYGGLTRHHKQTTYGDEGGKRES